MKTTEIENYQNVTDTQNEQMLEKWHQPSICKKNKTKKKPTKPVSLKCNKAKSNKRRYLHIFYGTLYLSVT